MLGGRHGERGMGRHGIPEIDRAAGTVVEKTGTMRRVGSGKEGVEGSTLLKS
jgi:hypothetical protein